jgi:hypothetical protein
MLSSSGYVPSPKKLLVRSSISPGRGYFSSGERIRRIIICITRWYFDVCSCVFGRCFGFDVDGSWIFLARDGFADKTTNREGSYGFVKKSGE